MTQQLSGLQSQLSEAQKQAQSSAASAVSDASTAAVSAALGSLKQHGVEISNEQMAQAEVLLKQLLQVKRQVQLVVIPLQ